MINEKYLNKVDTANLAAMAFPTLFPYGLGNPTDNATVCDISQNETGFYAKNLKHWVRFGECVYGKWCYRFSAHPRFGYWAYNIFCRKRI